MIKRGNPSAAKPLPKCGCGNIVSRDRSRLGLGTCVKCAVPPPDDPEDSIGDLNLAQVLTAALTTAVKNHEWHKEYDDHGGYPESELCMANQLAIELLKRQLMAVIKGSMIIDADNIGAGGKERMVAIVDNESTAKLFASAYNGLMGSTAPRYYRVVSTSHKLKGA